MVTESGVRFQVQGWSQTGTQGRKGELQCEELYLLKSLAFAAGGVWGNGVAASAMGRMNRISKTRTQKAKSSSAGNSKAGPLCFGKICNNFLPCLDFKPKSICIRLVVCQCRLGFQAPPVLGKLNWQFSILFRSKGHAADSRKSKKHKQHPSTAPPPSEKQVRESEGHAFRDGN